jgi:hypothetical protein
VEGGAGMAGVDQELHHGIERYSRYPGDRPHAGTLAKHAEDLDAGFDGQLVHAANPNRKNLILSSIKFSLSYCIK